MHYSNLVIIDKTEDIEAAVERAMGPSEENGGFWDWYQIGGRWTGILDGYDPEKDPANIEPCGLCGATGKRTDAVADANPELRERCNGCQGTGKHVKWPTQWAQHKGDIMPIEQLTQEQLDKFFRVAVSSESYGTDVFGGEKFVPWNRETPLQKLEQPPLDWLKETFKGCLVVVVDNHS